MSDHLNHVVRIKKIDEDKHVVFGEVYAPHVLDTYGEFMVPEDIELMAHRFAELELSETIDTNHDNEPNGSHPIESFIARGGDPDFTEGAWVLGVKVLSDHIWAQVKKGELNGFSFQAMVKPVDCRVKVDILRDHVGLTEPGGDDEHRHTFFLSVDETGRVVTGHTSFDFNHDHRIRTATMTGPRRDGLNNHTHRFFLE